MLQDFETTETLHEENMQLRRRNGALEEMIGHLLDELVTSIPLEESGVDSLATNVPAATSGVPYRLIFDQVPIPLVIFHPNGRLAAINCENEQVVGISRAVGSNQLHPDAQQEQHTTSHLGAFQQALHGEVARLEATSASATPPDATAPEAQGDTWTETIYFPIYDPTGTVAYIGAMHLDVVDHR